MEKSNILVSGTTGSIGSEIAKQLIKSGHSVYSLSRDIEKAKKNIPDAEEFLVINNKKMDEIVNVMKNIDYVINVTGAPIFAKWTKGYENEIRESRIGVVNYLVSAIEKSEKKPNAFINGTAAGYYGYAKNVSVDEKSPPGNDFWSKLVLDWENAADKAKQLGLRVVNVRTTLVLMKNTGVLDVLVSYFNKGLGGYVRPGDQIFPWISIEDEVGIFIKSLENDNFSGPINAVAGNISSKEFSRGIGEALGKKSGLPVPGFIIKTLFGPASDLVLKSQFVKSSRMDELGYKIKNSDYFDTVKKILNY
ncbi:TIGR01777 family oxidoreductase [Caldiplasma sukawensis]